MLEKLIQQRYKLHMQNAALKANQSYIEEKIKQIDTQIADYNLLFAESDSANERLFQKHTCSYISR